jgi:hypothetical protein
VLLFLDLLVWLRIGPCTRSTHDSLGLFYDVLTSEILAVFWALDVATLGQPWGVWTLLPMCSDRCFWLA